MEMMFPGVAPVQPAGQIGGAAGGRGSSPAFQHMLVQQISGTGNVAGQGEMMEAAPMQQVAALLAGVTVKATEGDASMVEQLMAMIELLTDKLEELGEGGKPLTEEQLDELRDLLQQMEELLAWMGAPMLSNASLAAAGQADGTEAGQQLQDAAPEQVKNMLQDALLRMQMVLQQGNRPMTMQGAQPLTLIAHQLQALQAVLDDQAQPQVQRSNNDQQTLPNWLKTDAVLPQTKDAAALLQRLNQQSLHPSVMQPVVTDTAEGTAGMMDTIRNTPEGEATMPIPFMRPDNAREMMPLLVKASSPTAYVLADEFAETMTGLLVSKLQLSAHGGVSEAKLMLFPEQLGQVDVKITVQNGLLTALFQADNAIAKEMLENQLAHLRHALQMQGLNVDKLEVTQGEAADLFSGHDGRGQGEGSPSREQGFHNADGDNESAFQSELSQQEAIQGLGYGRAINETI
ncbi:flagellar hook-length control protein FliK [Paenibacillus sp. J5C_2022]|uniref:flagellar hook-length control protein FliK n=1 Tax=Paenibacillus sp. J5C2022 TaxID=2977129 RepID=UPI0021D3CA10|nr:flagellar hook-length control protein FliK [Paenibacillus sp. J5C2022]MCU6707105.1 flagellar hook-length control protein FliK [Paenibacillus sp. J5C2022]